MTDYRPRLTVDLAAVRRNLRALKNIRPGVEIMPVVKADCYGLGAEAVVPVLVDGGCSAFYVSYLEEAQALEKVARGAVFYILNAGSGAGPWTEEHRPVHYDAEALKAWQSGPCGVQIDIGMNRVGMPLSALEDMAPREDVSLVIGHMSDAGDPSSERNADQRARFEEIKSKLRQTFPRARFGLSATGGLLQKETVEEDCLRPGVGLYGAAAGSLGPLEQVATFEARVLTVFDVEPGELVGYSGRWSPQRPSKLATLAVGYADGLPRSLLGGGKVFLGGARCPYAGAVSMDLLTVDITDAPGKVKPGDWAELFGEEIKVDWLADKAGTIGYELLTAVRGRTQRVYRDSDR
ncbi:alanine racemase [Parvularcula sp. ZS-1/3]|uniref:alanine racemase n=1 Tax=Parvularcula mediterranea TaxID=2732508 RepID=A0A7Y3W478_9PROT|nr:alanine racemase [Parvularcula mediterranea]